MRHPLELAKRWYKHSFGTLIEQIPPVFNFQVPAVIDCGRFSATRAKAFLQQWPKPYSSPAEMHTRPLTLAYTPELTQLQDCITTIFQPCLLRMALEKAIKSFWIPTIEKKSPNLPSLTHYQPACSPWTGALWIIGMHLLKMSSGFGTFQCPCQTKYYQVWL